VLDEGDLTSRNANHTWTTTVDVGPIEERYARGRLLAIEVVERNGLGPDGGRVTRVELRFEQGTVSETGTTARTILGLRSDWFTAGPVGGDPRARHAGRYIDRAYQKLAGRGATDAEITQWYDAVGEGDRRSLTNQLVVSDHFAGRMVDDLYKRALGRSPEPGGRSYWVAQLSRGTRLGAVGAYFFGSTEYFLRAGGTNRHFVVALYRDILGRAPDPGGQRYWNLLLDNGAARLDDVAAEFYVSLESRRQRAYALHEELLGPVLSSSVGDALASRLLSADDLALAAEIAASAEAYEAYGAP
jgi:hypothetical protein